MMLDTIRETIGRGKSKQYSVYLCGARVGTGGTKEKAQAVAEKTLSDAYEYQTRSAIAKLANDGSILVFRQTSADTAMYEFCRDGKAGSSTCMGRMTSGDKDFSTLAEYADYILNNYNAA